MRELTISDADRFMRIQETVGDVNSRVQNLDSLAVGEDADGIEVRLLDFRHDRDQFRNTQQEIL